MANNYSKLFGLETIGLRFFTAYGPWGRPDMALFLFTDAILNNRSINIYNNGELSRDFTYIDDIVNGVISVIEKDSKNISKFKLYNLGSSKPIKLLDFVKNLEDCLQVKSKKNMLPMQAGDVNSTWADLTNIKNDYNYEITTPLSNGVSNFVAWYKEYYGK